MSMQNNPAVPSLRQLLLMLVFIVGLLLIESFLIVKVTLWTSSNLGFAPAVVAVAISLLIIGSIVTRINKFLE